MICKRCRKACPTNHVLCDKCLGPYTNKIIAMDHTAPDTWQYLFPGEIKPRFPPFIEKDINTLLNCLYHELWTASAVIRAKILNYCVWEHYRIYESKMIPPDFAQLIKKIEEMGHFDAILINLLGMLRKAHDFTLDSSHQFPESQSIDICRMVLAVVTHISNYYLDFMHTSEP